LKFKKIFLLILFFPALVFAFGKNKVIYKTYNWKVVETQNYKIYIPVEIESLSAKIAYTAEKIYSNHSQTYDYKPQEKIKVLIFPTYIDFLQNNVLDWTSSQVKGFTEFIKGRVVIYYSPDYDEFYHIFAHEVNHAFQGYVLGRGNINFYASRDIDIPLWFIEGASEFLSIGVDSECEMYIKEALYNGKLPSLIELSDPYRLSSESYIYIYKEGQIFYQFITEKYGKDIISKLYKEIAETRNFSAALKKVFSRNLEVLNEEFLTYLRERYFPSYTELVNVELISEQIFEKKSRYNACPVEVGENQIAFITDRKIYPSLVVYNTEKNSLKKIITTWKTEDFLEFSYEKNNHIGVSTNRKIIFTTKSYDRISVYVYDLEKNKIQKIDLPFRIITSPDISRDGNRIVFSALNNDFNIDIYLYDITKKQLTRVTDDKYIDDEPRFLGEKYIVFLSKRNGKKNLYFFNLENEKIEKYLSIGTPILNPETSKDGSKIVFVDDSSSPSLYIYDVEKNELYQELKPAGGIFYPSFTKDGKILFSLYKERSYNIYALKPEYKNKVSNFTFNDYTEETLEKEKEEFFSYKVRDYNLELSFDYIVGGLAANSALGLAALGAIGLSDTLGNHRYSLLLDTSMFFQNTLFNNINVDFTYLNLTYRENFGIRLFHYSNYFYELYTFRDFFEIEKPYFRKYGVFGLLSYPFSTFDRIDLSIGYKDSDYIEEIYYDKIEDKYNYTLSSVSENRIILEFVHDSTLSDITGPVDGDRYLISFNQSIGIFENQPTYSKILLDYRKYFLIFPGYSFAFRSVGGISSGNNANNYPFYLGGFNSLRGYELFSFSGNTMFLFNFEFRFPLIAQWTIGFPFLIRMPTIWGSIYFDCGSAFDINKPFKVYEIENDVFYFRDLKCSIGIGLRLVILEGIKLFYDLAAPYDGSSFPEGSKWMSFWYIGIDF